MPEIKTYTPAGFKALQDELDYLVNVRVEENKKEIRYERTVDVWLYDLPVLSYVGR